MTEKRATAVELRAITLVLATGIFAGAVSMRSLDALLPHIAADYGTSVGSAGLAVTAFAISYGLSQLIYGPLGDRIGPLRVISWTAIGSTFVAIGCAVAPALDWLVAMRFVAGGVAAAIGPLTLAWLSHATSDQDRPVAVANMTAAAIVGAVVGQLGGGLIGQFFSWQTIFFVIAGLFAACGGLMVSIGARRPHLLSIGQIRMGEERRGFSALLRRPPVRLVLFAVAAEGFAVFLSFTYVAALLQQRSGLTLAGAGLLVAQFGMGGIVSVASARRIVRRFGEAQRSALGGGAAVTGLLLLVPVMPPAVAGAALLILGFGFFTLHNVLQVRATQMAPDAPGAAMSLFAAAFFLAQALGAMAGGLLYDRVGGAVSCAISASLMAGLVIVLNMLWNRVPARRSSDDMP